MTSMPGGPVPDRDEQPPAGEGRTEPTGAPGVELGMSESGGTFEPEEDVQGDPDQP